MGVNGSCWTCSQAGFCVSSQKVPVLGGPFVALPKIVSYLCKGPFLCPHMYFYCMLTPWRCNVMSTNSGHLILGHSGCWDSSVIKHQEPTLCWLGRKSKLSFLLGPSWNFPVSLHLSISRLQKVAKTLSLQLYLTPLVC